MSELFSKFVSDACNYFGTVSNSGNEEGGFDGQDQIPHRMVEVIFYLIVKSQIYYI